MDAQLRVVNIHLQMGIRVVEQPPHVLTDLHTVHGKVLIRAPGLHLEGLRLPELLVQIVPGAVEDGVLVLGTGQGPGDGDDPEHLPAGRKGPVQVTVRPLGLHIDGALLGVDVKVAAVLEAAADIGQQLVLKGPPVQPLEHHLAQLQEDHFIHIDYLLSYLAFQPCMLCRGGCSPPLHRFCRAGRLQLFQRPPQPPEPLVVLPGHLPGVPGLLVQVPQGA